MWSLTSGLAAAESWPSWYEARLLDMLKPALQERGAPPWKAVSTSACKGMSRSFSLGLGEDLGRQTASQSWKEIHEMPSCSVSLQLSTTGGLDSGGDRTDRVE